MIDEKGVCALQEWYLSIHPSFVLIVYHKRVVREVSQFQPRLDDKEHHALQSRSRKFIILV